MIEGKVKYSLAGYKLMQLGIKTWALSGKLKSWETILLNDFVSAIVEEEAFENNQNITREYYTKYQAQIVCNGYN